jgi:hypothetical protein
MASNEGAANGSLSNHIILWFFTSVASPIPRLPSSEEPTKVLAAASSTSLAPSPATPSPGVAGGRTPVSRPRPVHRGLGLRDFLNENNSLIRYF